MFVSSGKTCGKKDRSGEALFARSLALDRLNRREEAVDQTAGALQIFEQIESPQAEKVRQQLAAWQSPKEES